MAQCLRCGKLQGHDLVGCAAKNHLNPTTLRLDEVWEITHMPTDSTRLANKPKAAHDRLLTTLAGVTIAQVKACNARWPISPTAAQIRLATAILEAVKEKLDSFRNVKLTAALAEAAVEVLGYPGRAETFDVPLRASGNASKAPGNASKASGNASEAPENVSKGSGKESKAPCAICNGICPVDKCKDCPKCARKAHRQNKCPYGDENCSNCEGEHPTSKCSTKGCPMPDCDSNRPLWDHPHEDTKSITRTRRARIIGLGALSKDVSIKEDPPAAKAICADELLSQEKPVPDALEPCHPDENLDLRFFPANSNTSVITNYVAVDSTPSKVHVYDLVFADIPVAGGQARPISQRSQKARIFEALQQNGRVLDGRHDWATDYEQIWTLKLLSQNFAHNVQYTKPGGSMLTIPHIEFRFNRTLILGSDPLALSDVAGRTIGHEPKLATTALNALLTKHVVSAADPQEPIHQIGNNTFFVKGSSKDIIGAQLARGYFTSVRPGSKLILLNVNVTHAAFFSPLKVSKYFETLGDSENDLQEYGTPESFLKGRTVRLTYERSLQGNGNRNEEAFRTKVIAGFGKRPHLQQFIANNTRYTVREWFALQGYPISAESENLPCINVGLARPRPDAVDSDDTGELWVPAEFLELPAFQPFTKKLMPKHMEVMHNTALQLPATNHCFIADEGLRLLGLTDDRLRQDLADKLQIRTGSGLLRIQAKTLLPPKLIYNKGKDVTPKLASWDLRSTVFKKTTNVQKLFVLDLRTLSKLKREATDSATYAGETFASALEGHGIHVLNDPIIIRTNDGLAAPADGTTAAKLFRRILADQTKNCVADNTFFLVLLDDVNVAMYNALKSAAERYMGMHTVCLTSPKLRKEAPSLWSNLALKINIRNGGICHTVDYGGANAFEKLAKCTMVLGADVAHNGGATPSVAAVVGSIDNTFVNMPGSSRLQPARTEVIPSQDMENMTAERLQAYFDLNDQTLPHHILYYRDGVGEDQYKEILNKEVVAIESAYTRVTQNNEMAFRRIMITVVIVGKRHNTRFFAPTTKMTYTEKTIKAGERGTQKGLRSPDDNKFYNSNLNPGIVVDSVITLPPNADYKDFFLQSHCALAGTARSAHYVVLRNDASDWLDFDNIQKLSHAFCYTYVRATKGVSYCAPAYNADRLCDRVNRYLRSWMDEHDTLVSGWSQHAGETEDAFRTRICNSVMQHAEWKKGRNGPGPWHADMDKVMFWL